MEIDTTELSLMPRRSQVYGLRWGAIFAGLAVGVAIHLLLTLAGTAVLGTFAAAGGTAQGNVAVAAAAWNVVGVLLAAFVGGYIAARSSGLRRSGDGVLYGVVSWGATTLLFALLAGATGGGLAGMISGSAGVRLMIHPAEFLLMPSLQHLALLPATVVDSMHAQHVEAIRTAAAASAWSGLGILLSLFAAVGGGAAGASGSRRRASRAAARLSRSSSE